MSATKLIFFSWAGNNFGQPFYSRWMQEFACLMSGNWYSTQAVSECKGEPDESCWWQLLSPVRGEVVVNGGSGLEFNVFRPRISATTLSSDAHVAVLTQRRARTVGSRITCARSTRSAGRSASGRTRRRAPSALSRAVRVTRRFSTSHALSKICC